MIIYNVTIQVSWAIHNKWMEWLKNEHLPEILSANIFYKYQVVRLLEVDEDDGPTYAIQYYAAGREQIDRYTGEFLETERKKEKELWGDQLYSFSSLMEVIH